MSLPSIATIGALLLSLLFRAAAAQDSCSSQSRPNPISEQYPDAPTGTLNTTLLVIPIPYETARQMVPAQWGILKHAYHALLPEFPRNMYPVVLQAGLDHDIQLLSLGIQVPDFTVIKRRKLSLLAAKRKVLTGGAVENQLAISVHRPPR